MNVTICDRCGTPVYIPDPAYRVEFNRPVRLRSIPERVKYALDLCPDCFEEIQRWLAGFAFEVKPKEKEARP